MPELPEVETVRLGLNAVTLDLEILGGEVLLTRTIAHPVFVEDFLAGIQGTAIAEWQRRGKYLIAALVKPSGESAGHLGVHLRMTGQLLWVTPSEPVTKHTRVRFYFPKAQELRFVDQRTFGKIWWVPPGVAIEQIITGLQDLGPEPFSEEFSPDYFYQQLQRDRPIKTALLDQAIVAGIGNIYADESLFLTKIRPHTKCHQLKKSQVNQLRTHIIEVLETSIANRGTTFSDYRDITGTNGNYGGIAWVYGREGAPCRVCGTLIERVKLAGRSAHFCPKCQR